MADLAVPGKGKRHPMQEHVDKLRSSADALEDHFKKMYQPPSDEGMKKMYQPSSASRDLGGEE